MLPRRTPFSLPYPADVPVLADVILCHETRTTDARRFAQAAMHHNVAAYALDAVRTGRLALPDDAHRALTNNHLRRVARTGLLRREAGIVGPLVAAAAGTAPVFVKGPAIGDRFYGDWRYRPYADLDLMVPAASLPAVIAGLAGSGYAVLEEFRPGYAERFGHDVHIRRHEGATPIDVELHWRIGDDGVGSPLGHAFLLRRAERIAVGDASVLAPSLANQLLLASVHVLSDRARRLSWVNDIRLMADAADTEEWQTTFATADAVGGGLLWVLHRALDYASRHLRFDRARPLPPGAPPPFGPLRAVEELDVAASPHVGRLVALHGLDRLRYIRSLAVPTRAGLEGTVGGDGAGRATLLARHAGRAARGIIPPPR